MKTRRKKSDGVEWLKRRYAAMTAPQRKSYDVWHGEEAAHMRRTDIPYGDTLEDVDGLVIECREEITRRMRHGETFIHALKSARAEIAAAATERGIQAAQYEPDHKFKVQVACAAGWYDLKASEGGPHEVELYDTLAAAQEAAGEYASDAQEECRAVPESEREDWSPYTDDDCGSLWGTVVKLAKDAGELADMSEATEEHPDPADDLTNVARDMAANVAALPKAHEFGPELRDALTALADNVDQDLSGYWTESTANLMQQARALIAQAT